MDKHINEQHGELTVIAKSTKGKNGYLSYYWTQCSCGNIKRYRYDQLRKAGCCGLCEDFKASGVKGAIKG